MSALDERLGSSRVSRAAALASRLETEIMAQALEPGMRIGTKAELRERFGVALATISEAIRLMESRGLVAARPGPGGGVFVADADARVRMGQMLLGLDGERTTLRDCVEVRAALEPLICRQAARNSDANDIALLERCVSRMEDALDDMHEYFRANWAFHRQCAAVCENPPLQTMYLTMLDFLEAGLDDFEFDDQGYGMIAVHRELTAAIAEGEGERLEAAIRQHATRSPLPS